jgi:hypothetical protein
MAHPAIYSTVKVKEKEDLAQTPVFRCITLGISTII